MTIRVVVLAFSSLVIALPAFAAQPTASGPSDAASTVQPLGGPAIEGVCLLSREAIFANAKIGQAATARLQVLAQQAQTEIDVDRKPIDTDVQAFRTEQAKLSDEQRGNRQQALETRLQSVQVKAAQRSREIEATRAKVLQRIAAEAQPVIAQVYGQKKCGLLVDRNSVLGGNMSNDLTGLVVQTLDAKISTITFDREILPPAATSAQASVR